MAPHVHHAGTQQAHGHAGLRAEFGNKTRDCLNGSPWGGLTATDRCEWPGCVPTPASILCRDHTLDPKLFSFSGKVYPCTLRTFGFTRGWQGSRLPFVKFGVQALLFCVYA